MGIGCCSYREKSQAESSGCISGSDKLAHTKRSIWETFFYKSEKCCFVFITY